MADRRISGRIGEEIDLNVTFFKNGAPELPYAIRRVDIFKDSIRDENLVAQILIPEPDDSNYPSPIIFGDANSDGTVTSGELILRFDVPEDFTPGVYFDVWNFITTDPGTDADLDDETIWKQCCNKFWLYENGFSCWDGLEILEFAFEQLKMVFAQPSSQWFEVGMMPLPLYDFDPDLIMPALAQIQATISVETVSCELLVQDEPMTIGLRTGSYRANPFVLRWRLDTTRFIKGTYRAQVKATLPDGTVHASPKMPLTIS